MSTVGTIIKPQDCDMQGVPLDWKKCRACERTPGRGLHDIHTGEVFRCSTCNGHGSLEAAALARLTQMLESVWNKAFGWDEIPEGKEYKPRCERCCHPMRDPIWEDLEVANRRGGHDREAIARSVTGMALLDGPEAASQYFMGLTPWSGCDQHCKHGGPVELLGNGVRMARRSNGPDPDWPTSFKGVGIRASWRQVGVYTGSPAPRHHTHPMVYTRPWDLRIENLSLRCLRCWMERR